MTEMVSRVSETGHPAPESQNLFHLNLYLEIWNLIKKLNWSYWDLGALELTKIFIAK